jgi:inhibitor of KinA
LRLEPLGDQAVMAYCDDEGSALALAERVRGAAWPWLVDVVQAYRSVAVFYNVLRIDFDTARRALSAPEFAHPSVGAASASRLHHVPVCFELGLDLERVAGHTGLSTEAVIAHHLGTIYTVYAIGFCPGFPYLGYLPDALAGVPRLETPRLEVAAGSVGLTGRQTGIYTEVRPGGWNIVGRTPLQLVDVAAGYFPLRTGDRVQFERIDEAEFRRREGERM